MAWPAWTSGLLILLVAAAPVAAGTCDVPGTHATIQEAVDDPSCDLVDLPEGTSSESIDVRRSVTIRGPATGVAILAGAVHAAGEGTVLQLVDLGVRNGCPHVSVRSSSGARLLGDRLRVDRSLAFPCPASASEIFSDGFESGSTCAWTPAGCPEVCDEDLPELATDPVDGARAIGLCDLSVGGSAGLVEASYTLADGTGDPVASAPEAVGLVSRFGSDDPRSGSRLLALSSGAARAPHHPGAGPASPGFDLGLSSVPHSADLPGSFAECGGLSPGSIGDSSAFEVEVVAPDDAVAFEVDVRFLTADYGDSVCTDYMDGMAVLLSTDTPRGPVETNVAVDDLGRPITVLAVEACAEGTHGGVAFSCPLGTSSLVGSGYASHGATGWRRLSVPVEGGSRSTIRFAVWDAGDSLVDSVLLVDRFFWIRTAASRSAREGGEEER